MSTDGAAKRIACIDINRAMIANRASCIIGSKGFSLVVAVADKQDALRCQGKPVVFYSQELMAAIGTNNPVTFRRARDKAVAAGWLVFIPGSTRCPGQYLAKIPDGFSVPDYVTDYVTYSNTNSDNYSNTYSDTKPNLIDTSIGICSHTLTLTSPIPTPNTETRVREDEEPAKVQNETTPKDETPRQEPLKAPPTHSLHLPSLNTLPKGFAAFWGQYPKQVSEPKARLAYDRAVSAIVAERSTDGWDIHRAIQWLNGRATTYAKAKRESGTPIRYILNPESFLDDKRYNDDDRTWREGADGRTARAKVADPSPSRGKLFDPDEDA